VSWVTAHLGWSDITWSTNVREFRDLSGTQWNVFLATPHSSPSKREKILPETYRLGWLVFECDKERRRLAPVPDSWESLTDRELEHLCTHADVVPARGARRTQPTPGQAEQMQELLAQVIEEVCDQPKAQSLDTGELIRVEQTLSIAAHAAREAVALRRAARETQGG